MGRMQTRANTPILMLGVAGLGLSLAMFFDTQTSQTTEQKKAPEESEDEGRVIEVTELNPAEYTKIHAKEKKGAEEEKVQVVEDNRYKGDGSYFDKRLYFMKEAYRRSRMQVPVDQNIALAVKLASLDEKE